jgi:hypothetical protein
MLFADGVAGLLLVGLWLFCIIDVVTTPESQIRNLPKIVWLFVVIGLADLGSIAWLVAGRTWDSRPARPDPMAGRFPEYDRPGRHIAANPDDDEAFLRQVRDRAEQQRQDYEARRRGEVEREDRRSKGEE